jgi:hypothetical protein
MLRCCKWRVVLPAAEAEGRSAKLLSGNMSQPVLLKPSSQPLALLETRSDCQGGSTTGSIPALRRLKAPFKSATLKVAAITGVFIALWLSRFAWDYFDADSPANAAMQVQLKLFGRAIYEYHSQSGRWPTSLDDLARTSLPQSSYVWRQTARTIVFLWPQDLKDDPQNNGKVLLAYWRGGLFNEFGRVWVCWGDLRTEHLKQNILHARLRRQLSSDGTQSSPAPPIPPINSGPQSSR